jgi:hypothetical protein
MWPKFAKQQEPFWPEEAKCFLDRDCLQDGQVPSSPQPDLNSDIDLR